MTPLIAIQLVLQYGPEVLTAVEGLFQKSTVTASEVQTVFANLKPYSAFGIQPPTISIANTTSPVPTLIAPK